MKRERHIGLCVGLLFILAFGLIITKMTDSTVPVSGVEAGRDDTEYLATSRPIRPVDRQGMRIGEAVPPPVAPRPEPEPPGQETQDRGDRRAEAANVMLAATVRLDQQRAAEPDRPDATSQGQGPTHYTVQPGDTLSGIAAKVYGPAHEDEYLRIYQANRQEIPNESTIYAGQVLVIPPLPQGGPAPAPTTRRPAPPRPEFREMNARQLEDYISRSAATASRQTYVVRTGDTLTSIARRFMGDGGSRAVERLFQMNRGVLSDPDRLQVGMRLTVPVRPGRNN